MEVCGAWPPSGLSNGDDADEETPAKKTATERQLRGQIHPQRQVLSEYPTQRGVHRMSG